MKIKASAGSKETVTLRWDEGDYAGLEVICKKEASIGLYQVFGREAPTVDDRAERFARFGREVLVSWELVDDDDEPIPATGEGMNAIPTALAWDIVNRWIDEVIGVAAPLEQASSNGDTSTSQTSSPRQSRKPSLSSA